MKKYPTPWQRKTMWASLTAIFVILLMGIVIAVVWIGANVVAFLQPILIPVAIAVILAYLLDPVVTYLARRGFGRTKAVLTLILIAFLSIAALGAWIVPSSQCKAALSPASYHRSRSELEIRWLISSTNTSIPLAVAKRLGNQCHLRFL